MTPLDNLMVDRHILSVDTNVCTRNTSLEGGAIQERQLIDILTIVRDPRSDSDTLRGAVICADIVTAGYYFTFSHSLLHPPSFPDSS